MVKTGLMKSAILMAGLLASIESAPGASDDGEPMDESEQWQRFSQSCASASLRTISEAEADFISDGREANRVDDFWTADIAGLYTTAGPDPCDATGKNRETCASAVLAQSEDGWSPNVAGHFRMTSADVRMAGTGGALRVIEFIADPDDEEERLQAGAP